MQYVILALISTVQKVTTFIDVSALCECSHCTLTWLMDLKESVKVESSLT